MPYQTMQVDAFARELFEARASITGWNRLEGQPRGHDLDKSLSFEICDALWMLTRQWQMGELKGEDAASPVSAKIKYTTARLDQVRLGVGPVEAYDDDLPLEVRVEREHPPLNLRFMLEAGLLWSKHLADAHSRGTLSRDFIADFRTAFAVERPAETPATIDIRAHQQVMEMHAAAAGRAIDGRAIYSAVAAFQADTGPSPLSWLHVATSATDALVLASLLKKWFQAIRARYSLGDLGPGDAWLPASLEYSFSCSAPAFASGGQRTVFRAEEYSRGHLDWYSFDMGSATDPVATDLGDALGENLVESTTVAFVPSALKFPGMPASRLWEFENRKTNFGRITASTADLARLLFAEFGLAFGNDWFLFPLQTEVGRVVRIDGLIVTDCFGERSWIPAYGQDSNRAWEHWAAYVNASDATSAPESRLLLLPDTIDAMLESLPQEEVAMFRDEIANIVFAVEKRITLDDGRAVDGFEAFQARRKLADGDSGEGGSQPEDLMGAQASYRLMVDDVPENWIPFVPVRMPGGDNREIQLQRAALLRAYDGVMEKVRPRTELLRPGYPLPYFVHEEEVPRSGVRLTQTYQRTRHHGGRPIIWCGRSKRAGAGEGSSGLMFDTVSK